MKYPLAIVKHLYDIYGSDICLGYDIMCAFWTTLTKSSLGAQTIAFQLRGVVLAFHGHVHN
jgi:Kyakuja-Dileera-Zisupton transposase